MRVLENIPCTKVKDGVHVQLVPIQSTHFYLFAPEDLMLSLMRGINIGLITIETCVLYFEREREHSNAGQ